jgi:hypothetical protein
VQVGQLAAQTTHVDRRRGLDRLGPQVGEGRVDRIHHVRRQLGGR